MKTKVLVTGTGYFGTALITKLIENDFEVTAFDLIKPATENLHPKCKFIQGNITELKSLEHAFEISKCSLVFHTASAGLTGPGQLNKKLCYSVNLDGTRNVMDLCLKFNVTRLVYTSSYNVIFSNKSLENIDESEPYPDDRDQYDYYSRSKKAAEILLLQYDKTQLENGKMLRCCALRPNAIWGINEQRHLPRIAEKIESGLTIFKFGTAVVLQDWCNVNNLVQAHLKAAESLEKSNCIAGGQAYNISDGNPMDPYEFIRPIFIALKSPMPWISLPVVLAYAVAYVLEVLHYLIGTDPVITRNEMVKVTNHHYCNIEKAKTQLGYKPVQYKVEQAVEIMMKNKIKKADDGINKKLIICLILIIFYVTYAFLI